MFLVLSQYRKPGYWKVALSNMKFIFTKATSKQYEFYVNYCRRVERKPLIRSRRYTRLVLSRSRQRPIYHVHSRVIDLSTPSSPKFSSIFTSVESRSDLLQPQPSPGTNSNQRHPPSEPCRVASASYAIRSMIFPFGTLGTTNTIVVRISLVMLLMSLCLLTGAYAFSSKRSSNSRHFADASIPSEAAAVFPDISTPSSGLHMPSFDVRLPSTSAAQPNLFEEYMSRGLYTCTSSYLDALGKLHALMAQVYEDYQNCQKLMKSTPKAFSKTDIDALDDMLADWEREDAANGGRPPSSQSQEILTSAEFVREQAPPAPAAATPKPVVST
uniref:Transmembrane protein n=1 Tax=Panagrellus redivivus TaxID=6233 RepID=A0A7E5A0G2_PANRE